jgi:TPR repeat protein
MYYYGEGIEENKIAALDSYRKAAENGYAQSWINLAEFYTSGEIVEKDIEKAIGYFNLASDHGLGEADYLLAEIYKNEDGYKDSFKQTQYLTRSQSRGFTPDEG